MMRVIFYSGSDAAITNANTCIITWIIDPLEPYRVPCTTDLFPRHCFLYVASNNIFWHFC